MDSPHTASQSDRPGDWATLRQRLEGASVVRNPAVLPTIAAQFSVRLHWDHIRSGAMPFDSIALPAELLNAVSKRQMQFRAGRFCARAALRLLHGVHAAAPVPRGKNGAPEWPAGVTGSITHTDGFASAAVAPTTAVTSLGIDTERVMSPECARSIALSVSWPSETALVRTTGCDRLEALTVVFSAKEAVFKCLHGLVGRIFGFHDVRLVELDPHSRTFWARVTKPLSSEVPAGTTLQGHFEIDTPWIHTGMVLPSHPHFGGPVDPGCH